MHTFIHIYIDAYTWTHVYLPIYIPKFIYIHITYININVCLSTCKISTCTQHICVYALINTDSHIHLCQYTHICIHTNIHTCTHACLAVYIYTYNIQVFLHTHIYIYICVCVCVLLGGWGMKNFYGTSGHSDLKDAKWHPKQYHRSYWLATVR